MKLILRQHANPFSEKLNKQWHCTVLLWNAQRQEIIFWQIICWKYYIHNSSSVERVFTSDALYIFWKIQKTHIWSWKWKKSMKLNHTYIVLLIVILITNTITSYSVVLLYLCIVMLLTWQLHLKFLKASKEAAHVQCIHQHEYTNTSKLQLKLQRLHLTQNKTRLAKKPKCLLLPASASANLKFNFQPTRSAQLESLSFCCVKGQIH